jgi:hypothetical protein
MDTDHNGHGSGWQRALASRGVSARDEFRVFLEMGIARVAYMKKNLDDAERRYAEVVEQLSRIAVRS